MAEHKELWEQDDQPPSELDKTRQNSAREQAHVRRLLLPFTRGIDVSAIASALNLAQRLNATLVPLSLLSLPEQVGKSPRWEDIEASRDFLEFVLHKASRSGIPVERMEIHTHNPLSSIRALAQEMACEGIIVVVRRGAGLLLTTYEIKQLLEDGRIPLYVVSLPSKSIFSFLTRWFKKMAPETI